MLYVESNGAIRLTRGDTARLTVSIENDVDGNLYSVGDADKLTLTVKKRTTDTEILLQKVITGSTQFHITPEDTSALDYGKYKYDVQINLANGDVYTVIEPTTFELLQEVTW